MFAAAVAGASRRRRIAREQINTRRRREQAAQRKPLNATSDSATFQRQLSDEGASLFAAAMGNDTTAHAPADNGAVSVRYTGWLLKRRTVVHHKRYCVLLSSGCLLLFEDKEDADVALSYPGFILAYAHKPYAAPFHEASLPESCPPHDYMWLDPTSASKLAFTFYGVGLSISGTAAANKGGSANKTYHVYSLSAKEDHELLEWQRQIRRVLSI
jgi:hypothetical protein